MKNKMVLLLLTLGLLLSFGGCTREEVVVEPDTSESIEIVIESSIKSPLDMTKEELLALTPAEIQEMVETYLPNYRETYGIDADREMSDADWLELRDFIYYQIYGEIAPSDAEAGAGSGSASLDEENPENVDPNWIYYAPTAEYINSLSTKEFGQYLNDMNTYLGTNIEGVDFTALPDEELEKLRADALENLVVDHDEYVEDLKEPASETSEEPEASEEESEEE